MRVALELQPCCGKRSGIGIYTYELAKHLSAGDGITFQGNLFNFRGRNDNSAALEGIGMPIAENRLLPYGVYRRLWNVVPFSYESLFPPADITHFFNYIVPPKTSGKIITTIHDMTYLRFPETMDAKNLRRIRSGITRSIEVSERIVTVSEFSKREIVALLGVPADRVTVVYNAASVGTDTEDFSSVAARCGIRQPYILYVGTIEPRKNLTRLLRAFEQLKREAGIPHQLVLAGGRGWRCDEIYRTASKIEGTQDVVFCGYVRNEAKNSLYANASVFVFPSLYEGFGIPPLEAMTMGCPVVCAGAASLPEVVGDAARLVDPLDEVDIAEGIWQVLSDSRCACDLRERGRIQTQRFSWERSAQTLFNLYRSMEGPGWTNDIP